MRSLRPWASLLCCSPPESKSLAPALGIQAGEDGRFPELEALLAKAWTQAPGESSYSLLEPRAGGAFDVVACRCGGGLLLLHRPARPPADGLKTLSTVFRELSRSRDAVVFTDAAGTLLGASPAWCALYGLTPEKAVGQNPRLINSRRHPRSFFRGLWRDLTNRRVGTWSGELVNRGVKGELLTVWQTITTFRDSDGGICGYLGITRDMTAHHQLRDRLSRSNIELAAETRSHNELLAMTAHDLKSPLHALLGWVGLASYQLGAGVPDEAQTSLTRAGEAGKRMEQLIQSIVDSQQVRGGHFELNLSRLSVRALLRTEVELHRAYAARSDVKIELNEKGPALPTFGDELRLSQAFVNVLTNAIKFSPTGGTIRVDYQSDALGNHQVSIEDEGPGIPPAEREKVFDLLYQIPDRQPAGGFHRRGSGWGLFIARKVMDLHGGSIHVEDGAKGGCRMVLRLGPLWRVWEDRPWAVAVLDPQEVVWPRIARTLKKGRAPVFAAHRPEELFALVKHELPNLIIHPANIAIPAEVSAGWRFGDHLLRPAELTVGPDQLQGVEVLARRGPESIASAAAALFAEAAA